MQETQPDSGVPEKTTIPPVVWIEAERFDDPGGWAVDTQFIDQMGSPYLLAAGLGEPVTDAVTRVRAPHAGTYRLWARTCDWCPEYHPGRFQVLIDGDVAARTFGAGGRDGWVWEDGGLHDLVGETEIRLHDLTGHYGRCDALALCADPGWTPPEDREEIARLRARCGGVSPRVEEREPFDVVVVGGGVAGCMAAVSAARLGARVALIQDRPLLGGNASLEILVPPVGSWPHGPQDPFDPHETGLVEEVRTEGKQRTEETRVWSQRLLRWVTAEPNVTLFLETHVTGVERGEPPAIEAVTTLDVRTGERMRVPGALFVDATGDAVVGVAAGAEYRHGREPRSLYGESLAPETVDATTMGNSLKYFSLPTDAPVPFAAPAWALAFPICDSFPPRRHPPDPKEGIDWQWVLEIGGTRDTYRDKEEIRDDLLRLIYGIWDHVKNRCPRCADRAATHRLAWVGHVCGMRESRRLIGDTVFTENDVARQTLFPDRIAYGAWGLDDHYSEGFFHRGEPSIHPYKGRIHSVPYRSLYSKNVANLFMAGRNLSASHVGMGTTRVMLTCAVIAQAVGTAAALCVRYGVTPRAVYERHLHELQQQLLKDGAYIVALRNADPRDRARTARVTASSEAMRENGELLSAVNVVNGVARAEGGRTNAWMPRADADAPHWVELRWPEPVPMNVVHVTFQTRALAPRRFEMEMWSGSEPVGKIAVDDNRFQRQTLGFDRISADRIRLLLPEPAGVCEIRVYDEPEEVVEAARRAMRLKSLPDEDVAFPWGTRAARPEG